MSTHNAPTVSDRPVALVSGGSRGLGRAICVRLAQLGYQVALGSRDVARGRKVAAELASSGLEVEAVELDVARDASVSAAAAWLENSYGRCDAVVNNAAIHYDKDALASAADLGVIHEALETNLFGAWRVTLALLPLLRGAPHPRVVNVSSDGGSLALMTGGVPAYRVSKAALNALTRLLADELAGEGILVNAIDPGVTATDMSGHRGRPPEESAAHVVWGVTLPDDGVTGGYFRDRRVLPW
jgi:NAD(P)-dependent dehydrogenase (short-subunit alcohol dehydrogenase family)